MARPVSLVAATKTSGIWNGVTREFHRARFILKVNSRSTDDGVMATVVGSVLATLPVTTDVITRIGEWALVRVPDGTDIPAIAKDAEQHQDTAYAQPDLVGYGVAEPNDPYYASGDQWGLTQINVEEGWDLTTGSDGVLIGIIDSGIAIDSGALDNPDLSDTSRITLGGDYLGDTVDLDALSAAALAALLAASGPQDNVPEDIEGHGTHVTGIAAASTDQSSPEGIAGMNWVSPVYVTRVLDIDRECYESQIHLAAVELIDAATAAGRKLVINLSIAFTSDPDGELETICNLVNDYGGIICCGAGKSPSGGVGAPALYATSIDAVIAVGATQLSTTGVESVMNLSLGPEITVVAPGDDIISTVPYAVAGKHYDLSSGTSMATAFVTGLASLMWSHNSALTSAQIRDIMVATADKVDDLYSSDEYWRINAGAALAASDWEVTLYTPHVDLVDVPEGYTREWDIILQVRSSVVLAFRVSGGPTLTSGDATGGEFTMAHEAVTFVPIDPLATGEVVFPVRYTGTSDGDAIEGGVTIACGALGLSWDVTLSANTVAVPTTALAVALDKSGSMGNPSGISGLTRLELMKEAAGLLIDVTEPGNGIGLVSFDSNANDHGGVVEIPGEGTDAARSDLHAIVDSLTDGGNTSIGNALEAAQAAIDGSPLDNAAILVLTDGKETASKYIPEVMGLIGERVFAVAMGDATNVDEEALYTLTDDSGGYLLLTGDLDDANRNRLQEYFLQVLAGATNANIPLDPQARMRPGCEHEVPFVLTTADVGADVYVVSEAHALMRLELLTPGGEEIPHAPGSNPISFAGRTASFFRFPLPLDIDRDPLSHAGTWRVRIAMPDSQVWGRFIKERRRRNDDLEDIALHGARYSVIVHARSNLAMDARWIPHLSSATLRVVLTQYGRPLERTAHVSAAVSLPDGTAARLRLASEGGGVYSADLPMPLDGTYCTRIRADGRTREGEVFRREQIVVPYMVSWGDIEVPAPPPPPPPVS